MASYMRHTQSTMVRTGGKILGAIVVVLIVVLATRRALASDISLDRLVFVTQANLRGEEDRCNAVTQYLIDEYEPYFRISTRNESLLPHGLAATTDFSRVFVHLGYGPAPRLPDSEAYLLSIDRIRLDTTDVANSVATIPNRNLTWERSIAVMPDDETLLVEESSGVPDTTNAGIAKYCLSEIGAEGTLGPRRGYFAIEKGHSTQIIPSRDGRHAHLVPASPYVEPLITLDVSTMRPDGSPITKILAGRYHDGFSQNNHLGTITPDEGYIITTRRDGQWDLLNLKERTASKIDISTYCDWPMGSCGEAAFNHGPINHGLLAFRGTDQLVVFEFKDGQIKKLGKLRIARSWVNMLPLAWSGDGSRIVVNTARQNGDQLLVVKVTDGGRTLTEDGLFRGCGGDVYPQRVRMILTANRRLDRVIPPVPCVPPTMTPTSSPTSTTTPTASRTFTASPSVTATTSPSSTASPSPTASPTPAPRALYLPLLLRERCLPEQRRVDVVLVLDASLSMLEPAGADAPPAAASSKLDAARDAARAFLDALRLAPSSGQGAGQAGADGDQAAIVVFNSAATLLSPLTSDRAALDAAIATIAPAPQTCIVCAVEAAAAELASGRRRADAAPVLILLTDGRSNPQPAAQAVARAQAAKAAGVRIYTIGLGADLDEAALRQMASGDDGYRHAPSATELAGIYRRIAVDIPCPVGAFWAGR